MSGIELSSVFSSVSGFLLESAFSPLQIIISLTATLVMALFIFYIYKRTYNGVLYSPNFNLTLVITALTVNAIMIGISGSVVLSLGLVGALSVIRFRTAVKDPKDTAFLFWSISVGVINGVSYYELSAIASVFIASVLLLSIKWHSYDQPYILILKYATGSFGEIEPLLEKAFKRYSVRTDSRKGEGVEKVIEVKMKGEYDDKSLDGIRRVPGVQSCVLIANNGEFAE